MRRLIPVFVAVALLTVTVGAPAAEQDIAGSRDPYGIERVPRSWIVGYAREDAILPRELATSRVDRIRRNLRVEDVVQVSGSLEWVTYQIPEGTSVDAVVDHYRQELGGDVLFACSGRACGRSADWAHQVFEQSVLYGPDANQRYVALEWQDRFAILYVNERGNKRVYAHLRIVDPEGERALAPNVLLGRRLAERGWSVVDDVQPNPDGTFGPDARRVLADAGGLLQEFAGEQIYLVCHLYGAGEELIAASGRCAEEAARLVTEAAAGEDGDVPVLQPFGAGPLLPRRTPATPRIELVLPARVDTAPAQ